MGLDRVNFRFVFAIVLSAVFSVVWPITSHAQFSSFASGDIVAGIGYGKYNVFDPKGNLLTTLDTTTGSTEDTGGAFDADGNLFVTNFQANSVSEFNIHGSLVTSSFGGGYNLHPESITLDRNGNIYVGQADGTANVSEFSPSGTLLKNYAPAREDRGTDWITLAPDGKTLFYTSEGKSIKRFDIATGMQLPNFADNLPGPYAFALRVLPNGNVLVADTSSALLLDAGGNILRTYTPPGEGVYLFALAVLPNGLSFVTGDIFTGEIYQFNIATGKLENQFSSQKQTTLAGLIVFGEPGQSAEEFKIIGGTFVVGEEPSIAVDPNDSMHAVVGFNKSAFDVVSCGWAESRDGGRTWNSDSISLPTGFHGIGDPWVRYAPDGELFYTCMAATDWHSPGLSLRFRTRQIGVFAAVSGTGLASDFEIAGPVDVVQQFCTGLLCDQGLPGSELTDHPAFSILTQGSNHRLVACWVDSFSHPGSNFLKVAVSDDGRSWSHVRAVAAGYENACTVGGNSSEAAVTWFDSGDGNLKYKLSQDGIRWSTTSVLSGAGPLVNGRSTTATLLSVPYALVVPNGSGLTALWQWRNPAMSISQVSRRTISPLGNDLTALGDPKTEKFLPGSGTCGDAVGTYYGSASGLFRYAVWGLQGNTSAPLFISTTPFSSAAGNDDPNYPGFKRIGDYTGVDCSGQFVWAAWTDLRNNRQEIWGSRILLPRP